MVLWSQNRTVWAIVPDLMNDYLVGNVVTVQNVRSHDDCDSEDLPTPASHPLSRICDGRTVGVERSIFPTGRTPGGSCLSHASHPAFSFASPRPPARGVSKAALKSACSPANWQHGRPDDPTPQNDQLKERYHFSECTVEGSAMGKST